MWAQGCLTAPAPPAPSSAAAGIESPVTKVTQLPGTGRTFVPLSTNRSKASPSASPFLPSILYIFVCVCFLSLTHMHLVYLSFSVTPSYAHTPFHLTASPLLLQVKHQGPPWLCARCLSQALQSSTVCLSSPHCADLYWFNVHSCFSDPPKCALLLSPVMEMFLEWSSKATVDGGLNWL